MLRVADLSWTCRQQENFTLGTGGEDVKTTLQTSREDVNTTLEASGKDQVGNCSLYTRWSEAFIEEFFVQGDVEKQLGSLSYLLHSFRV